MSECVRKREMKKRVSRHLSLNLNLAYYTKKRMKQTKRRYLVPSMPSKTAGTEHIQFFHAARLRCSTLNRVIAREKLFWLKKSIIQSNRSLIFYLNAFEPNVSLSCNKKKRFIDRLSLRIFGPLGFYTYT